MSSIIKVQNIQYTDGDAALTIADGGGVTAASNLAVTGISTLSNTLNVSTSSNSTNTATFVNSSYTNSGNGVVHVKQSAGTNQPTMVIEQTGTGGNPADTQGLHIKIAGQNQGNGQAIRVTTTNSNLNSGNAYDAFSVTNGGNLDVKNTSNASTLSLNRDGQFSIPKQPLFMGKNSSTIPTGANTSTTTGYSSSHTHYKPSTIVINNGNHFDNTNGIFTAPVAGFYMMHCTFSRTSDNWVALYAVKNTTTQTGLWFQVSSGGGTWQTRDLICIVEAAANDKLYFTYPHTYTAPSNNNETMMTIHKIA
tara:strand:- start:16525 stop:17445 length:921 start_codon:yes stop_codon:yes gene_type:complete